MPVAKILLTPSADWFTAKPALAALLSTALEAPIAAAFAVDGVAVEVNNGAVLTQRPPPSSEAALIVEVALVGGEAAAVAGSVASDPTLYDVRVVLDTANAAASAEAIAAQLLFLLKERDYTFISTRHDSNSNNDAATPFGFLEAVKEGLCKDGGLFMPRDLPAFTPAELAFLCAAAAASPTAADRYHRTAQFVLEKLLGVPQAFALGNSNVAKRYGAMSVPTPSVIAKCVGRAYEPARWNGLGASVSPLTPLLCDAMLCGPLKTPEEAAAQPFDFSNILGHNHFVNVLEQYHGPTAAFKDFALQLFPSFFAVATAEDTCRYMILAATSGDTGVAAINGFMHNGGEGTKVMVLFPEDGVSPVQKAQMLSYSDGKRVQVVGLGADFDYCQSTVKRIFNDASIAEALRSGSSNGSATPTVLSSANSINWGRLLPQIVYYVHAYVDLVAAPGRPQLAHPLAGSSASASLPTAFDVVVPSGNFGNILSCYVAKKMGLPVRRFVVASNENDVLADFINTGVYDITKRTLATTSSPSIDILRASNVERFLYFIHDGDTNTVRRLMQQLDAEKRFALSPEVFEAKVKNTFWASTCAEQRCRAVVKDLFVNSCGHRLLDPHTGVAAAVTDDYIGHVLQSNDGNGTAVVPIVLASTAHWGKFPEPVMASLGIEGTASAEEKKNVVAHVQMMHNLIQQRCPAAQPVPSSLRDAVAAPAKSAPMVMRDPTYEGIVAAMHAFAGAPVA